MLKRSFAFGMKLGIKKHFLLFSLLVAAVVMSAASNAGAADVYMSKTGTKASGKSTTGDWSNANCYSNLHAAMAAMSSGDTLTIDDGVYTGANNSIDQNYHPPSGTSKSAMTVVRARNIPCQNGVACNQTSRVYFQATLSDATHYSGAIFNDDGNYTSVHHVKFWGIKWDSANTSSGWDYIYFKQCAFMGVLDGNNVALNIGGRYNLVEDCVAYGKGRYKFLTYDLTRDAQTYGAGNNIFRRCVARNDWAIRNDSTQDPIATFVSYYNRHTAFINSIDIDSDSPTFWRDGGNDEFNGAYSQPVDDSSGGAHRMRILGSMSINNAMGAIWGASPVSTASAQNEVTDFVAVRVAGGINLRGGGTVNRLTMVDVGLNNFTYRSTAQSGAILQGNEGVNSWDNSLPVTNSILKDIVAAPFQGAATGDYVSTYLTGSGGNTPTHRQTYNPSTNGLLYPVRIEAGLPLATAGSGGGQVGATILYRIGQDGQFQDDAGWDQPTATSLWPYPNEEWIKAEMASMPATISGNTLPSATRGFATATGKRLDGTNPVTLTSYIWESLGNPIPAAIYNTTPDTSAPVVASLVLPATSASQVVPVSTFTATDNVAVTGYAITESTTAPSAGSAEWSATSPGSFTFSGTGTRTAYGWAKDAAGNISAAKTSPVTIATDTVLPTASITSPATGGSVSGTVSVTISASDNVGVVKVELYQNGTLYASYGSSPYVIDWNTTLTTNGNCTLTAKSYDLAGNVGQSSPVTVTINNPLPDVAAPSVSAFTMPATATSLTVAVSSFTAADNTAVAGYLITESSAAPSATTAGWTVSAPVTFTFSASGARTAYGWAKDAAGNISAAVTAAVTITLPQGTGNTYYVSPSGSDSNPCTQALPCRQLSKALTLVAAGDTILLADGTYAGTDVTKTGTAQAPITIKAQGSNAVISARANVRGNLYLNNCSYVIVDGIKTSGGTGSLAAGIAVRFSNHVTVKNSTSYNNNMWGIFASNSPNLVLENNETYGQITQHGIYVADATASHDQPVLRNNRSHNNALQGLQLNADNGGTGYFTGALIENNIVYNNGSNGLNMDGVQDSIIRNNLFYNNHGSGITMFQLDAATGPKGNQVYHNTIDMASDSRWAIRHTSSVGVSTIRNNIFYNRNSAHGGISTTTQTDVNNTDSDYNIFAGSTVAVTPDDDSTFYSLAQWKALGKDQHSFTATPSALFANLTGADYHLAAASPAIDKGQALASVAADRESHPRPQGAGYDIGTYESLDTMAPTVTSFALPAASASLTVAVSSFTATDNASVAGYMITETAAPPAPTAAGWTVSAPASITFSAEGSRTAYAWAKDSAGNVSASLNSTVTITVPDTTEPVVNSFIVPGTSTSLTVPVSSLLATDNIAVTGYLITESAATPSATASGWSAAVPASITFSSAGTKTVYAWAKDAAGNVSAGSSTTVIVTLSDSTAPTVTLSMRKAIPASSGMLALTATASDNIGVSRVEFYVNGVLVSTATAAPYTYNWNSAAAVGGSYSLTAKAFDGAGNSAQSGSVKMNVPNCVFL